jgi:hypothetical protein
MPESDGLKNKMGDAASVDRECVAIEEDLAALRMAYEQFFLGLERHPPTKKHDALKKRIAQVRNSFVRSTVAQFRVQGVIQKMMTYERLWTRTIEQMENGTYRRDVFKAKLRHKIEPAAAKPEPSAPPSESSSSLDAALAAAAATPRANVKTAEPSPVAKTPSAGVMPAKMPGASPTTATGAVNGKAPAPQQRPAPGSPTATPRTAFNETKLKEVYDAYLMAKKRCNEDVSKLSYDAVASTLRKQVPEILKRHNARDVDFKVIIKDGKAVLKAVPKE